MFHFEWGGGGGDMGGVCWWGGVGDFGGEDWLGYFWVSVGGGDGFWVTVLWYGIVACGFDCVVWGGVDGDFSWVGGGELGCGSVCWVGGGDMSSVCWWGSVGEFGGENWRGRDCGVGSV